MKKLYWAYGSNLNKAQMKVRCPGAKALGPLYVDQGCLVFRHHADVVACDEGVVPGGLWQITNADERALDRYEGVGNTQASGYYRKLYMAAEHKGEQVDILFYQMNSKGIAPPSEYYLEIIKQGYIDFGLDLAFLEDAVEHSWENKRKTADIRARLLRHGRPKLAKFLSKEKAA